MCLQLTQPAQPSLRYRLVTPPLTYYCTLDRSLHLEDIGVGAATGKLVQLLVAAQ
jgi:hypothetical protein